VGNTSSFLGKGESMQSMLQFYIRAALWSSSDESRPDGGEPLDKNYSAEDIAPDTLATMSADCEKFQADNAADIERRGAEQAGHDFWLTRNGHGCGFWDGDWPEPAASRLTTSAENFGTYDLYVGDDGQIWG
jgi:hypothetical protein